MTRKNYYAERIIIHAKPTRAGLVIHGQPKTAIPNRLDRWSGLLAAWAQVVTLIVVIFGYFYTVVPVFQRDRLEEEVAKLEIQRERVEAEARQSITKSELLKQSIAGLHQEQAQIAAANKLLLSELQQLASARREAGSETHAAPAMINAPPPDGTCADKQMVEYYYVPVTHIQGWRCVSL